MKKILSFVLAILIACSMMTPTGIHAATLLNEADLTIQYDDTTTFVYTGKQAKPIVYAVNKVGDDVYEDTYLYEGIDYTVSYENNINAGTGYIVLTGIGEYEGTIKIPFTINKDTISTASLSSTSFVYSGNARKPIATVKDKNGTVLEKGIDYTVSYENNIKVGKAKIIITGKGNYKGKITKTFTIKPKGTSISSVTSGDRSLTVRWYKQAIQTTGYQLQRSTSSKFTSSTTKSCKIASRSTLKKKYTGLVKGKKYYVRIRTYKNVNGTVLYSKWSSSKNKCTNAVTKMTLNTSSVTIKENQTYQVKVKTVTPTYASKTMKWSSSNKNIATVSSSGKIRGINKGTCTITATSNSGIKRTVKVTVNYPTVTYNGTTVTLKNKIARAAYKCLGNHMRCTEVCEAGINAIGKTAWMYTYYPEFGMSGYGLTPENFKKIGTKVSESNRQQGDIIYYKDGGAGCSHVGVYIGKGLAIQGNFGGTTVIFSAALPSDRGTYYRITK